MHDNEINADLSSDAPQDETRKQPLYSGRFVSVNAIAGSSFIGGPLAGAWLLAKNYRSLGNARAFTMTLVVGILLTVVLFGILFSLPAEIAEAIPGIIFPGAITALFWGLAKNIQEPQVVPALARGAGMVSGGYLAAVIIMSLIITIGPILLVLFGLFAPGGYDSLSVTAGEQGHYIYYKNVSEAEAQDIGDKIIAQGYFNGFDFESYAYVQREGEEVHLLFPIKVEYWDDADIRGSLLAVLSGLREIYGMNVRMYVVDDTMEDSAEWVTKEVM